jgi:hypothetical protein
MFHPEREEVAHYFRFAEIRQGRSFRRGDTPASGPSGDPLAVDWTAVYPMRPNPRSQDFHGGTPVVAKMAEFNQLYSDLLRDLHRAFNGEADRLFRTIPAMLQLKTVAQQLMQMPSGDHQTTAGPSFEYMPPIVEMRRSRGARMPRSRATRPIACAGAASPRTSRSATTRTRASGSTAPRPRRPPRAPRGRGGSSARTSR